MLWRADLGPAWEGFWYRPESARNLAVARILLAATALWVVLSRPSLPEVLSFPPDLWIRVSPERRLRFLLLLPMGLERWLYAALHLTLLSALLGILPRFSCFASGLLLYHFAPLETIIRTANPYLRGLTIPTLGLLILSFSRCGDALALGGRRGEPAASWEYRWPLALVQVLLCEVYLFAGYSKLVTSGLSWVSGENMRGYLLLLNQALMTFPEAAPGYALARSPAACAALAWTGIGFELAFPLVLFSGRSRWVLLPLAVVFHAGNVLLFRIPFQNLPLLLVFVGWDSFLPAPRGRL